MDLWKVELAHCGYSPAWIADVVELHGPRLVDAAIKAVREHGFSAAAVESLLGRAKPIFLEVLIGLLDDTKKVGSDLLVEGVKVEGLLDNPIVKEVFKRLLDRAGPALSDFLAKAILQWIQGRI